MRRDRWHKAREGEWQWVRMPAVLIILSAVARFLLLLFAFHCMAFVRTRSYDMVLNPVEFFSTSLSPFRAIRELCIVIQNAFSLVVDKIGIFHPNPELMSFSSRMCNS